MPRKKRPSARASREWRDAGDALRTNRALAKELRVSTPERARDVLTAAVLCESLAVGPGEADVRSAVTRVRDAFPSGAVSLRGVSVARASKRHRYLVADAPGAVFVACAGTQDARDLVTDASVRAADLELAAEARTALGGSRRARLFAHGGFASRARSLRAQIRALFRNAVIRDGKRLVLCGHSLGGAVAALAMLGLLLDIEDDAEGAEGVERNGKKKNARRALAARFAADGVLCCVGFAAPPPGDEATRLYAEKMGWTRAFVNICSREDFVPRLMLDRNASASKRDAETTPASESLENREIAFARKRVFPTNGSALSWRPAYAHVSPVHMVARDGAVTVVDARDVAKHAGRAETKEKEKEKEKENAERESAETRGFFGLGAFSAKKVRDALAEHTMRAHRARLVVTCATALAEERSMTSKRHGWFNWLKWGFGPNRGEDAGFFFSSTGRNPSATLRLPPPAGDALFSAPQPRPSTAAATVDLDGESRPSLLVTVTGEDLELCESVAAETNGWPCGATLVAKTAETTPFSIFQPGALRTLNVRVYPPTLNGALVPAPLFNGGGDAKDWSRVVVALRGDFGDARVAVRVEEDQSFAETPRSRL
jgi:hypothetical protein